MRLNSVLAFVVARIALFIMKRNSRLIEGVIKDRSELPLLFLKSIKKKKRKKIIESRVF